MKWWLWAGFLMAAVALAQADVMTLSDGNTVSGSFAGFSNRKFEFKPEGGERRSEYPLNVAGIVLDAPAAVSAKFSWKQYDYIDFVGFDHNTLRLRKEGKPMDESVLMLKELTVVGRGDPRPASPSVGESDREPPGETPIKKPVVPRAIMTGPRITAPPGNAKGREWRRSGKWREIEEDTSQIISRGETVDVEASLRKGYVNIVHFHMPSALTSIREGNYVQALARKRSNQLVVWKVVVQDFRAPICSALNLTSLPQFWLYDAQGKLVTKLTDRFTEGDIDAAIKSARLGKIP